MIKKKMLFVLSMRLHKRNPWINLSIEQAKRGTQVKACYEALIERQYNSATPEQLDCQLEEHTIELEMELELTLWVFKFPTCHATLEISC